MAKQVELLVNLTNVILKIDEAQAEVFKSNPSKLALNDLVMAELNQRYDTDQNIIESAEIL